VWEIRRIHLSLITTAEIVYASCSTGLAANFLLRKPNGCLRALLRLVRPVVSVWIQAEGTALYPRVLFCFKIRKSMGKPVT
jgi:hypothetical protein